MKLPYAVVALALIPTAQAQPQPTRDVVCSYAPSQSNLVAAVSGAAGGASATLAAVAAATGLTVVTHSSGALILTGMSGYIAGTIGAAAVAPVIIGVGLVVGGGAVTLELVCASKNRKDQVQKVEAAAEEFSRRFNVAIKKTIVAGGDLRKAVAPVVDRAVVETKRVATDVWEYVNRVSDPVGSLLSK